MPNNRQILYNKAYEPFSGFQTIETIDCSDIEDGYLFMLDILIHTSNGQNILEICSFVHFQSVYQKVGGVLTALGRRELKKVISDLTYATIQFIDGVDYQEVITGTDIDIQVNGTYGTFSYITSYVELDCVKA